MLWEKLLSQDKTVTLPWVGGKTIHGPKRSFRVSGDLPKEHGWHRFVVAGSRRATWVDQDEMDFDVLQGCVQLSGYLVEDRLIPDGVTVRSTVREVFAQGVPVYLSERGLDRFVRVRVARIRDGKLVFMQQELPLGPEAEVLEAFQDKRDSLSHIPAVTPALELAFMWHCFRRRLAEQERERAALRARVEAQEQERIERRARFRENVGLGGASHRFEDRARDALAVSGATLLDARPARHKSEMVVQFRHVNRRFECVVRKDTLRIIDAGICLEDHATGERGDQRFTLESLPAVVSEAADTGRLVVFRHVN